MTQPKKDTALWWLMRIADDDLRERAVRACVNPNAPCANLSQAIIKMCQWSNTDEHKVNKWFWQEATNDAWANRIELFPEPYINKNEAI